MINRGFAIRKNVVGLLVVAWWLIGYQMASAQESGKEIFQKSCAACHSIGGGRLVGPDLKGVNDKRTEDWLLKFIKSAQKLVKSGDKTAAALFEEFNKIPMPDQALSDDQIMKVLAHIKETGGSAAPGMQAALTSQAAPVAAQPGEIRMGRDLFDGRVRFANGGASCNSCHHVQNDAVIGGGVLARDLTTAFSRLGAEGISAMIPHNGAQSPFPVMQVAYQGREVTDNEANALVAFLQHADKQSALQKPGNYAWRMFIAGCAGVVVMLIFFGLVGHGRKKRSVNSDVYDRQLKSADIQ